MTPDTAQQAAAIGAVLNQASEALSAEAKRRAPEVAQLQAAALQATREALAITTGTGPDMAKLRAAMAVILGAG